MSHQSQRIYEFDPFRLDVAERILLRDGEVIQLQPKVFDLLLALVERHGRLLEKDELMKLVWPDAIVEEANLANNISILRKTLSENGERFIETVPKRGYRFVASVKKVGEENAGQVRSEQSGSQSATNEKQTAVISAESAPSRIMASAGGLISRLKLHKKSAITTASALIIAATGVSLWLFNFFAQRLSPPAPEPRLIPFTSLPGEESQPTFSPDGNQIAFVWRDEKTGRSDIYVKLIDAETRLRLTDKMTDQASHTRSHISPIGQIDLSDEVSPSWSPDGHDIAFLRRSSKSNGVYIVSALGGAERKVGEVFADDVWANYLHWAPDGKHLVIEDKDTPQEPFGLFLLSVETGEKRRLTTPPSNAYGDFDGVYSPDGRTIAFKRRTGRRLADIYLAPAEGGAAERLTFLNQGIYGLVWTPDSREIIFSSSTNLEDGVLFRVSVPHGTPERMVKSAHGIRSLAISPQGNRLAYTQFSIDTNVWRLDLLGSSKGQSNSPAMFISSTRLDSYARYSPDGKKIVFISNRSGSGQIWVCDSDGSNPRQLTNLASLNGEPNWSPDSRYIVFDSRVRGSADIFVVSVEGGQPRALTTEPSDDVTPSWSGDGRWVYFSSNRGGSLQIWKMPAEGGQAVQVTKQGGYLGRESVDGKFVYYMKDRGVPGIWRVPAEGSEEVLVLTHHKAGLGYAWTVVDKGIYFATAENPTQPLIEFYSFATRKVTQVAKLTKAFGQALSVSPDGQWLLYTQVDQFSSDIMLMENFR